MGSLRLAVSAVVFCVCAGFVLPVSAADGEQKDNAGEKELVDEAPADEAEAFDIFTEKFVWSENYAVMGIDQYGREISRTEETSFYKGRHRVELDGEDFYRVMDRDDLADDYRRGRRLQMGFAFGGLGVMAVGAGLRYSDSRNRDDSRDRSTRYYVGIGAIGVGALSIFINSMIDPHPVEPHERRQIAEDYNMRLLDELQLDEDDLPEDEDGGLQVENLEVNPYADVHADDGLLTGGLLLGGQF